MARPAPVRGMAPVAMRCPACRPRRLRLPQPAGEGWQEPRRPARPGEAGKRSTQSRHSGSFCAKPGRRARVVAVGAEGKGVLPASWALVSGFLVAAVWEELAAPFSVLKAVEEGAVAAWLAAREALTPVSGHLATAAGPGPGPGLVFEPSPRGACRSSRGSAAPSRRRSCHSVPAPPPGRRSGSRRRGRHLATPRPRAPDPVQGSAPAASPACPDTPAPRKGRPGPGAA